MILNIFITLFSFIIGNYLGIKYTKIILSNILISFIPIIIINPIVHSAIISFSIGLIAGMVVSLNKFSDHKRKFSKLTFITDCITSSFTGMCVGFITNDIDFFKSNESFQYAVIAIGAWGGKSFMNWMLSAIKQKIIINADLTERMLKENENDWNNNNI